MITAIVLAAGLSHRMGRFKLTLPWGETTVIGCVVSTLEAAGVSDIIVVTGHRAEEVSAVLSSSRAHSVFNPCYGTGDMLSSVQTGLRAIAARNKGARAGLLCLGDQPQMASDTVRAVLAAGAEENWARIVIPSYHGRAGHPILLPAWLWPEVLACTSTLRNVLGSHRDRIRYLTVDAPSILADLDTPEDYRAGSATAPTR